MSTPIARLRTIGLIESLSSFALFFVAMPIKWVPYLTDLYNGIPAEEAVKGNGLPVTIVGSIHGGLFCIYILAVVLAVRSPGLPRPVTALAFLASLFPFPFGYLLLDPKLKKLEA